MIKHFEACVDEFKLPPNITIQIMTLNSQGKGDRGQQIKVSNRENYSSNNYKVNSYDSDF